MIENTGILNKRYLKKCDIIVCIITLINCIVQNLMFYLGRNHNFTLSVPNHCVVKISAGMEHQHDREHVVLHFYQVVLALIFNRKIIGFLL